MTSIETVATSFPESTLTSMTDLVKEVVNTMQLELCFLSFFLLGYVLLRLDKMQKMRRSAPGMATSPFQIKMKQIRAAHSSNSEEVASLWRETVSMKFSECCPLDVLRMVTLRFITPEIDEKGIG